MMIQILALRDRIKNFIQKNQKITYPVGRLLLYVFIYWSYAQLFHFSSITKEYPVMIGVCVLLVWLPIRYFYFLMAGITSIQLITVSTQLGIAVAVFFCVVYALYLRYDEYFCYPVLLIPVAFLAKLWFAVPVIAGMTLGVLGVVPVLSGVLLCYMAQYVGDYTTVLQSGTLPESVQSVAYIGKHMLDDNMLWLTMIVFSLVIIVVAFLYRISIDYAWYIAVVTGSMVCLFAFLFGSYYFEMSDMLVYIIVQTVLALLCGSVAQFFLKSADYSRAETVEFSDDEYYYYVKAVPKVNVPVQDITRKKISTIKDEEEEDLWNN
ncbi:MAG: hypothetical protein ACI4CT_02840 [Lachnospiraceae bacterium]